jgi:hypothetical protein
MGTKVQMNSDFNEFAVEDENIVEENSVKIGEA